MVAAAVGGGLGVLAVKSDGTVWECISQTASQVSDLSGVVAVASGLCHDIALKSDGTVWEWPDAWTQLPDRRPYQIKGVTDVMAIAAGETRSLAVKRDGTLWEWTGATCTSSGLEEAPRAIAEGVAAVSVAYEAWMGSLVDSRTVALRKDGTVVVWHKGEWSNWRGGGEPQMLDLTGIVAIAAGPAGDAALKEDGTVWRWDDDLKPEQVAGLSDAIAVAVDAYGPGWVPLACCGRVLALKSDGTVWAGSAAPLVQVDGLAEVTRIAATGVYLGAGITPVRVAIKRDGTLRYW